MSAKHRILSPGKKEKKGEKEGGVEKEKQDGELTVKIHKGKLFKLPKSLIGKFFLNKLIIFRLGI